MKLTAVIKSKQEMARAWREWHAEAPEDEVPNINPSFKRAWEIQQAKIEKLNKKMRVLKFAILSASEVMRHGTEIEMRETAAFLRAIDRITEAKDEQA